MVKIKFPDGGVKEFESGVTGLEIAQSISPKLAKEVLSISVNGEIWDLTRGIFRMQKSNCLPGKMKKEDMLSGIHQPI